MKVFWDILRRVCRLLIFFEGLITSIFWAQGAQDKEVFTNRHGVTSQKPSISISTFVRTSDFTDAGSVIPEYSLVNGFANH